jgi:hypothetical protein
MYNLVNAYQISMAQTTISNTLALGVRESMISKNKQPMTFIDVQKKIVDKNKRD